MFIVSSKIRDIIALKCMSGDGNGGDGDGIEELDILAKY